MKKQPYEVFLCINEGLELVANVFKSFLARYLERKFVKRVVLLVPMPDTDIDITALLTLYPWQPVGRVRNPKNQLLQIEPPTIVGCSLWYPIARSTMKPEARLSSSQKYQF